MSELQKGIPARKSKGVLSCLEGGSEEDAKRNRAREAINSPFVSKFSLVHDPYTYSPTRAQRGHINSLRGIRIGPFQTPGGWMGSPSRR